jgi:hypothetical protein
MNSSKNDIYNSRRKMKMNNSKTQKLLLTADTFMATTQTVLAFNVFDGTLLW